MISTVQDTTESRRLQEQLQQAQKMEAVGTLASGIAHDFNNILSAIYGYSELAQLRCPEKSKLRNYVEQIATACIRAKNLVQQILTFSRRGITEKRLINISSVVEEALTLIRATFPSTIEIRQDLAAGLRDVLADETQIHQVVMNLCTNAYQAMGNDGGLLEISLTAVTVGNYDSSCYPVVSPGRYLKLIVADTGKGMEPAQMERIFDPYFTTKKRGEGTGLGLSVVHGIVKKLHGQISVYSEPGRGTVFHVLLPCIPSEDAADITGKDEPVSGGGEHIVVVDDEKPIVALLTELLTELGYRVSPFTSSEAALSFFKDGSRSQSVDLLITDMNMPKMCGDELSRHILALFPTLPIVICTGFSDNLDANKAKAIGIREYLAKPVTERRLAASIRRLLD